MLTKKQVEAFHKDGFVAVRKILAPNLLRRLQDAADEMLEESRELSESNKVFDLELDHTFDNPRLRRIRHPVAQRSVFWEAATSELVLNCVSALIGKDVKFHHSKLNMKTSKGGSEVGWHQDFVFFPHTNFDLVACGFALDRSTKENGCLIVVPGSHKWPILNHRNENGDFIGAITEDLDQGKLENVHKIELEAGDMSIHHASIVHGSTQNISSDARRLFICQYAACDAIQLDKQQPVNEFSERVVRGNGPTHARLAGAMSLPLRGDVGTARSLFELQETKS